MLFRTEWIDALMGGALIGFASTVLLVANGRISGISGIFFGLLKPVKQETLWRFLFVVGLLASGVFISLARPELFENTATRAPWITALAGLLVGFGSRLGGGCTSGHGVCGISRLSPRSILATLLFIVSAAVTMVVYRLMGGS